VAAHVAGLLREILLADEYRLIEIARLSVLVRQRRKVPARIFFEFLTELVDSGGGAH
jgi:hypothetical protein